MEIIYVVFKSLPVCYRLTQLISETKKETVVHEPLYMKGELMGSCKERKNFFKVMYNERVLYKVRGMCGRRQ